MRIWGSSLMGDNPVEKEVRSQKSVKNWILSPVSCILAPLECPSLS